MFRSWHLSRLCQIAFLCSWSLWAAPGLSAQMPNNWEAVPKEDLDLKDNPAHPGDSAMILERRVYTDDEKRTQTEWLRIKILTEGGRAYADIEIPYVARNTSIEDIQARTVRSDGTVIAFSGAVFDKNVLKYKKFGYNAKVFSLPGADVGSVIEYSFAMRWKDRLPDYVRNPAGYLPPLEGWSIPTTTWIIQGPLFTRHAVFVLRPVKNGAVGFARIRMPLDLPLRHPDGTISMELNNVAPIEEEEYSPPESFLNSRVHFYYMVGFIGDYWRTFGRKQEQEYAKFVEKTSFLERAAKEIAPPSEPPDTRLRKLYARAQQIRDVAAERRTEKEREREDLPENKSAEDILRHGYGYGNQTNFLFTALARAAGFDASIVQVVDRRSALFEPEVLDPSQLNAMVVLVKVGENHLYLDPATRFCPYGMLPWFESDTKGVRWNKLGGTVVVVKAQGNELSSVERRAELKLQSDGSIEGTLEVLYVGQGALDWRLFLADEDESGRVKLLGDDIKELAPAGATIDVESITGWQESTQPLHVKCRLHAPRYAALAKERMLFPIAMLQANRKSRLHHVNRAQPIYFTHSYSTLDKISITLPAGYRLEAVPTGTDIKTSFAEFHAQQTSKGGVAQLERSMAMYGYYFSLQDYAFLREYLEKVRQSDGQVVVLRRAESAQAH